MHLTAGKRSGFDDISDNQDEELEVTGGVESYLEGAGDDSHPASMEQDKRIRREIANSNERRRMQSINAGFQTLRALLPQREGEKLSKAAILQQTSDFIYSLEQEKTRLLTQNCQLKRLLGPQPSGESDSAADSPASSARRSVSQEEPPRVPAASPPAAPLEPLRLELLELRAQLERERLQRQAAEQRLRLAEEPPEPEVKFEQPPQHSHQVHMRFKKPRLELESPGPEEPPQQTALPPPLVMTEHLMLPAAEEPAPPPPPPAASHRPMYVSSTTSRQNLDTIVEAIRHLEGDHLFGDSPEPLQTRLEPIQARLEPMQTQLDPLHARLEPQDAPLELTTHARAADPYRPGVIVAQHHQLQHHQHELPLHQQHHQHELPLHQQHQHQPAS